MTTATIELPPIGKISMIGVWFETLLYGINCVMYGLCMFILLRGGKIASLRWVLVVVSTMMFFLCTVHVAVSLQQLLNAFVYAPPDVLDYSTTYWLDYSTTLRALKDDIYVSVVFAQYVIIIWRLYVVFMCDWKVVILPVILAAGVLGPAYAATVTSAFLKDGLYRSVTTSLVISATVLAFVLQVSVAGTIAVRLWWIGRSVASLSAIPTNRFASLIYIIIESGSIAAICSTVIFALFVSASPFSLAAVDVITQLTVLMQLLIVVQAANTG